MPDDIADEYSPTYRILVEFFIQRRGMSIDEAHEEVDAIYKYVREAGDE